MDTTEKIRVIPLSSMTTIIHFCKDHEEVDKVEDYLFDHVAHYEHTHFNVIHEQIDVRRKILNNY